MTRDDATRALRAALREVAPEIDFDSVATDADLREELSLDSLDFLRLVEQLSTSTGVRIDEADYPHLSSIDAATAWLAATATV
jgi:acyl carrier protein